MQVKAWPSLRGTQQADKQLDPWQGIQHAITREGPVRKWSVQ